MASKASGAIMVLKRLSWPFYGFATARVCRVGSGQLVSASAIAGCAALEALKALEDLKGFKASCKQREY